VRLDKLVPQPGDPNAVVFWANATAAGPILACVLPLAIGWLLGAFVDFQWVDKPVNFLQGITILGTMMFPFAAYYAARRRWNEARARASVAWPTVPGKVEQSKIETRQTARSGTFYRLALIYRYDVGGRDYEGDTVEFGPPRVTNQDLIERLAAKYPVGAPVTVHYDPDAPGDSVLETSDEMARQNMWQVWFFLGMPIVVSILSSIVNSL
jgi:hypothetical protein